MSWLQLRFLRDFAGRNSLATAFAISLAVHGMLFGAWRVGKALGWWQHQSPSWLLKLTDKIFHPSAKKMAARPPAPAPPAQKVIPLTFMEVDPALAAPEPPKDAKYYGVVNAKAANPDATVETTDPKLDGKQEKVPRLADVPKPEKFPLQPAPPEPKPAEAAPKPKPAEPPGDLALAKPQERRPGDGQTDATAPASNRPRTLREARIAKNMLAGEKMKQDGGVKPRGQVAMVDVKATPFGAYDAAFIAAVQQRWYDLLDSSQFVQRSGKVVLQFRLNYDGRITDMRVGDNDVGELLCLICQRAVLDPAPYPRWPSDMRRMIGENQREVTFTFYYN